MSSDFRGPSADNALPGPPQSGQQPLPDPPTKITSEANSSRPSSDEKEKPDDAQDEPTDEKSVEGDAPPTTDPAGAASSAVEPAPNPANAALLKQVNDVLNSEIGITTLLNRLKQSVASAKEFATFLKKRALLEDDHAQSLKKLSRQTQENMRRPDHRQGSFARSYDEMMFIHDRMAENGIQFAASLHQMYEDLFELANNTERNRKVWKTNGLIAEQKVADLEQAMRKSKSKYDSLAEEYDRTRTGEGRQSGKVLGAFKAHKSAAQQEEDLLKKAQNADQSYKSHVQALQTEKSLLQTMHRPEAVKALQDMVSETDSATTLQMQKFAAFNEKLLLGNGLIVYPFKNQPGDNVPQPRSLRQAIASINNERDLNEFVAAQHSKMQLNTGDVKYERNPLLNPQPPAGGRPHSQPFAPPGAHGSATPFGQMPPQAGGISSPISQQPQSMGARTSVSNSATPGGRGSPQNTSGLQSPSGLPGPTQGMGLSMAGGLGEGRRPFSQQQHGRSFSQGHPLSSHSAGTGPMLQYGRAGSIPQQGPPRYGNGLPPQGAPQLGALPFQSNAPPGARGSPKQNQAPFWPSGPQGSPQQGQMPFRQPGGSVGSGPSPTTLQAGPNPLQSHPQGKPPSYSSSPGGAGPNMPLSPKPVFAVSLATLYERDGLAVPLVVYQCIQAVDMYGLGVEGIYRQSGSLNHINKLKSMFDADSQNPALDFRNPESFYHDVNSVTGLLKQFLRDLPDPILTMEHHDSFIQAAKHDDEIVRRDSLHAIINSLPDPNYATLRALTLHLYRVMDNSHINRMNSHNLAVIFGPTLMGSDPSTAMTDAGWQIKVIDTILQNTYQIFDED